MIILKSNYNVPADGVARAKQCFTHLAGDRKKCNEHLRSFQKRSITLKNEWLPQHFMSSNGSGKPIQHVISFWLWAKAVL